MEKLIIITILFLCLCCSSIKEIYHKTVDDFYYENCNVVIPPSIVHKVIEKGETNKMRYNKVSKKFIDLLNKKTNIYKQYCYGREVNQDWTKIIKVLDTVCWLNYTKNKHYYWLEKGEDLIPYYYLLELSEDRRQKVYRLNFSGDHLTSIFLVKEEGYEKTCNFKKKQNRYSIKCDVSPNDTRVIKNGKVMRDYNLVEIEVNKYGRVVIKK